MTERIFAVAHLADMAVLYLLLSLAAVAIYIIMERFFFLRLLSKQSKKTLKEIEVALMSGNYSLVEKISETVGTIEGRASKLLLEHLRSKGRDGLDEIFSAFVQVEKPKLERSLGFLATVGSNAPYIGLFGTVLGIMKSFNDLSQTSAGGQGSVMAGISAALIATAAGLMVAIPAVLAYNYFQKQVKSILGNLEAIRDMALTYSLYRGEIMASKANSDGDTIADINIVPLVDIILVVLIIFMVTAPAVMKPNISVDLPQASSGEDSDAKSIHITITSDERILFENQEVTEEELRLTAQTEVAKNPEAQAVIAADQGIPYGIVVRVMDWMKSSGVKNLAVSTDRELE